MIFVSGSRREESSHLSNDRGPLNVSHFWGNQTSEGISLQCVVWARNIVTLLGGSSHLVSSLVTSIYKPVRPFIRGASLLRGLINQAY